MSVLFRQTQTSHHQVTSNGKHFLRDFRVEIQLFLSDLVEDFGIKNCLNHSLLDRLIFLRSNH